eukprot:GHVU01148312.1.p1 GENE.GHVU01148312.1~~GHVU01148312.1.p1  ORF type:complete len:142 (+),score=12.74 GHVU01148312.1:101-526(+)
MDAINSSAREGALCAPRAAQLFAAMCAATVSGSERPSSLAGSSTMPYSFIHSFAGRQAGSCEIVCKFTDFTPEAYGGFAQVWQQLEELQTQGGQMNGGKEGVDTCPLLCRVRAGERAAGTAATAAARSPPPVTLVELRTTV